MTQSKSFAEVRFKGKWIAVPTLHFKGNQIIATGRWLKIARVRGEEMMERGLTDPNVYCAAVATGPGAELKADIFTFTQKLPDTQPKYGYPMDWDSVAAIYLESFDKWWAELPQETRKNVRRSTKRGVSIQIAPFNDDLINGIRDVNDDTPLRQGTLNAYYRRSFEDTYKRYGEFLGRCDFICAYSGEEMIGFLHLVYRDDVAAILNLTVKPSHSDKRPANALMARAVEICSARGLSYITYGLYNYGNKRDSPLRTFKIRHGFREFLVPRYFVPLTIWGRFCIVTKLYRGFIGILPEWIIIRLLGVRSFCYNFKQRRCSSKQERPNCNRQMESSNPPAGSNVPM